MTKNESMRSGVEGYISTAVATPIARAKRETRPLFLTVKRVVDIASIDSVNAHASKRSEPHIPHSPQ